MFNSFIANYLIRLRVSTHVTVTVIDRLPVPRPADPAFREMAALARQLSTAPDEVAAAANHQALAARIYGVTAQEFEHVLGTFPLVDIAVREAAIAAFMRTL